MDNNFDPKEGRLALRNQKLAAILKNLPLENCEYRVDSTTGKEGWYAPQGFAFKITGQFVIDIDHSTGVFSVYIPTSSYDLYKTEEIDEMYQKLEGSPTEFIGKWLYFGRDYHKNPTVVVTEDIDPYFEDQYYLDFNGFYLPLEGIGGIEWTQRYAKGEGLYNIELTSFKEQEANLYVPKSTTRDLKIVLPLGVEVRKDNSGEIDES